MKRAMQPKMDISLLVQKFAELQAAIAAVHQESLRLTKNMVEPGFHTPLSVRRLRLWR